MKKLIISALAFISAALIAAGFISACMHRQSIDMTLYYFDSDYTSLTGAVKRIYYSDNDRLAGEILDELINGSPPLNKERLLDKDTKVLSLVRDGEGRLSADFSSEFLNSPNTLLSAYGVIKSLCGIEYVESVRILVDGSELDTPNGGSLGYICGGDIIADYSENNHEYTLPLYFEKDSALVMYERNALSREGEYEYLIMKNLISGADGSGAKSLFNPDTQLIGARTSEGSCFVNLDASFFDDNSGLGDDEKRLLVYSAVNSLTESGDINTVIFLFNGRRGGMFGDIDMSAPFYRNEELIG